MIHDLHLPVLHSLLLFQMLGTSKLQHIAQLRPPPADMRTWELKAQRLVCAGPGSWTPRGFFPHLKDSCSFPSEIRDFSTLCAATMLRAGTITIGSEFCDSLRDKIKIDEGNPDANINLIHPFRDWLSRSSIMSIPKNFARLDINSTLSLNSRSTILTAVTLSIFPKMLKAFFYKCLLPQFVPFSLVQALAKRFKLREWFDDNEILLYASKAAEFIADIKGHVPPCVIFAVLRTYFNGWATSARFQTIDKVCLLCFECDGVDSLEHYAECAFP